MPEKLKFYANTNEKNYESKKKHKIEKFKNYYEVFHNVFRSEDGKVVIVLHEGAQYFFERDSEGKTILTKVINEFSGQKKIDDDELEKLKELAEKAFGLSKVHIFKNLKVPKGEQKYLF